MTNIPSCYQNESEVQAILDSPASLLSAEIIVNTLPIFFPKMSSIPHFSNFWWGMCSACSAPGSHKTVPIPQELKLQDTVNWPPWVLHKSSWASSADSRIKILYTTQMTVGCQKQSAPNDFSLKTIPSRMLWLTALGKLRQEDCRVRQQPRLEWNLVSKYNNIQRLAKCTCCSCWGPRFWSQNPHGCSQTSAPLSLRDLRPSSGLQGKNVCSAQKLT